jgi:hypothetical protein
MSSFLRGGLWAASVLVAGLALAANPPMPKVMSDAPTKEGQWRMQWLEMPGTSQADLARMGGGMTICQTAAKAMAREEPSGKPSDCQFKLAEDSATRAVMEVSCPSSNTATRTVITRTEARSYDMSVQDLKEPNKKPMRMRMSYLGECSAKDSVISMDKSSPACQQVRGQRAEIERARAQCAKNPQGRAQCEQMLARSLAQIEAMCGK